MKQTLEWIASVDLTNADDSAAAMTARLMIRKAKLSLLQEKIKRSAEQDDVCPSDTDYHNG